MALPVFLIVIALCATLLRVWALDGPPLSWDEGNNAYFTHRSVAQVVTDSRLTRDADPPAHRLALTLWLGLLGDSARNLRLLSAVLGVATVLLVFQWARCLAGAAEALAAAALTAFSPALVYYSREAKAYPLVTFFGLAALYLWSRHLDGGERRRPVLWLLYVLAEALALGAHYYAVFLILAQGIWLAIDVATNGARWSCARGRVLRWLAAQAAVAAVLLPWVSLTLGSALAGAQALSGHAPLALPAYLRDVLSTLGAGLHAPVWAAAVVLPVLGVGVGAALARRAWSRVGLLACVASVPILSGLVAQSRVAFFAPRFLLYTAPALFLLAAIGLSRLRLAGLLLGVGLAVAWLGALPGAYGSDMKAEEDLRPLAQTLGAYARPGDGVIVGYIWQEGILRMLEPCAPVSYHVGWFEPDTVELDMQQLLAAHRRLWLVTYRAPLQHPQNPGGWWLEQHAARGLVTESGWGRLVLYLAPPQPAAGKSTEVTFEEDITLTYTTPVAEATPGEALPVPLHWRADGPPQANYSVFVHLYDWSGRLCAQSDGPPVNGLKPFPQFLRGETVADYRALWLPPGTPPGQYVLKVGLYDPATGARLKVASGVEAGRDATIAGEVRVVTAGRQGSSAGCIGG